MTEKTAPTNVDVAGDASPAAPGLLTRLRDRGKWPRRWWWPPGPAVAPAVGEDEMTDWQEQHDEASKTIRRVMLTIVGYCFFCVLTLSTPDTLLVENSNKIKLPFANIDIDFLNFLIVGPVVLIGLLIYMHIFVAYWRTIPPEFVARPLPYIFNMPGQVPRWLSGFLFYWLAPLVLLIFVWKASGLADVPLLLLLTALVALVLVFIAIRYRKPANRRGIRYAILWFALIALVVVGAKLGWERGVEDGPEVIAFAADVVEPVVVAILPEDPPTIVAARPPSVRGEPPTEAVEPPVVTSSQPKPPQQQQQQQVVQKSLSRALNLAHADLRKSDLFSLTLNGADMRGANLQGVSLGIKTKWKNIENANLSGADLSGSKLTQLNFRGSNLTGASFANATLDIVDFARADLRRANFTDIEFGESTLPLNLWEADLRGAIGLDCSWLTKMNSWENSYRDPELACDAGIPVPPAAK